MFSDKNMNKRYCSRLKVYYHLTKIGFFKLFVYKGAVLFKILNTLFFLICQIFLWRAVYNSNLSVNNFYKFEMMISYILLSLILYNLYPVNVSSIIARNILSGDISYTLLKPVSFGKLYFFEHLGSTFFNFIFVSLPFFISFLVYFKGKSSIFEGVAVFILSYIYYYLFELFIGMLGFFTLSIWGINSLKIAIISLLTGRLIPISMFPAQLQKILYFLPFKIMFDLPINIIIGKENLSFKTVLYIFLLIFLQREINRIFFNYGIKKMTVQGG